MPHGREALVTNIWDALSIAFLGSIGSLAFVAAVAYLVPANPVIFVLGAAGGTVFLVSGGALVAKAILNISR